MLKSIIVTFAIAAVSAMDISSFEEMYTKLNDAHDNAVTLRYNISKCSLAVLQALGRSQPWARLGLEALPGSIELGTDVQSALETALETTTGLGTDVRSALETATGLATKLESAQRRFKNITDKLNISSLVSGGDFLDKMSKKEGSRRLFSEEVQAAVDGELMGLKGDVKGSMLLSLKIKFFLGSARGKIDILKPASGSIDILKSGFGKFSPFRRVLTSVVEAEGVESYLVAAEGVRTLVDSSLEATTTALGPVEKAKEMFFRNDAEDKGVFSKIKGFFGFSQV